MPDVLTGKITSSFEIFLKQVEVGDGETGTMYEFECNKWLADDEDDNLIVRELECSKTTPGHGKKKEKEEKGKGKDKKGKDKKGGAKKDEAKEDEEEEGKSLWPVFSKVD